MVANVNEERSRNMRAVKSSGSKIERTLALALWNKGLRYRKNVKTVYGKPDIVFNLLKIAIFCDSEYWHGYNWEIQKETIKTNKEFWLNKIKKNIERDFKVNQMLIDAGWTVLRFWGTQIIKDTDKCVREILLVIEKKKQQANGKS
jgi:DNA mismatch endonuclease (patch repair protein)